MNSNFHFSNPNNEYIHVFHPGLMVHMVRISHSIASLSFTDEYNNKVPIPKEIRVYTFDFTKTQSKVVVKPSLHHDYALCWTDNYTVEWNGEIVLNIKNKRSWKITSNEITF